jgi:hypothetical protein
MFYLKNGNKNAAQHRINAAQHHTSGFNGRFIAPA